MSFFWSLADFQYLAHFLHFRSCNVLITCAGTFVQTCQAFLKSLLWIQHGSLTTCLVLDKFCWSFLSHLAEERFIWTVRERRTELRFPGIFHTLVLKILDVMQETRGHRMTPFWIISNATQKLQNLTSYHFCLSEFYIIPYLISFL